MMMMMITCVCVVPVTRPQLSAVLHTPASGAIVHEPFQSPANRYRIDCYCHVCHDFVCRAYGVNLSQHICGSFTVKIAGINSCTELKTLLGQSAPWRLGLTWNKLIKQADWTKTWLWKQHRHSIATDISDLHSHNVNLWMMCFWICRSVYLEYSSKRS